MAKKSSRVRQLADTAGMPNSWRALIIVLFKYGPWTLLAGFLIWVIVWKQGAQLDTIQRDLASHKQASEMAADQTWTLIAISQRICLNTAKTDTDRLNCVLPVKPK